MVTPRPIVIFGAGGYAKCVGDAAQVSGAFDVVAFIDRAPAPGATLLGRPVIAETAYFSGAQFPRAGVAAIGDNFVRMRVAATILEGAPDFQFASVVHPRASIAGSARLGGGSVVLAGAVVNADAVIGLHATLWSNAVVEHDNVLGNGVTLAPAAALGGSVRIGDRTFLGMGSVVTQGVVVGADCVVGAGALVTRDVDDLKLAVGAPARAIRTRSPGDPYL
jgi:sugar O-acyltransferase (sialic acid O-acetyltransferase NeuD family)